MASRYSGLNINFVEQFNTVPVIDSLRAMPIVGIRLGDACLVTGNVEVADFGGGIYIWAEDSLAPDDGFMVIKPDVLSDLAAGRWHKMLMYAQPIFEGPIG